MVPTAIHFKSPGITSHIFYSFRLKYLEFHRQEIRKFLRKYAWTCELCQMSMKGWIARIKLYYESCLTGAVWSKVLLNEFDIFSVTNELFFLLRSRQLDFILCYEQISECILIVTWDLFPIVIIQNQIEPCIIQVCGKAVSQQSFFQMYRGTWKKTQLQYTGVLFFFSCGEGHLRPCWLLIPCFFLL